MKNLSNLFVQYNIAKSLKLKGFDDCCFGYYENNKLDPECPKLILNYNNKPLTEEQAKRPRMWLTEHKNSTLPQWAIAAPTYEQVNDWLRKNHNINIVVLPGNFGDGFRYHSDLYKNGIKNSNTSISKDYYQEFKKAIKEALKLI